MVLEKSVQRVHDLLFINIFSNLKWMGVHFSVLQNAHRILDRFMPLLEFISNISKG
jgi:hypothetical protein